MLETMLARLVCDEATAKRLADSLSERFEEAATAAFEGTDGRWNLEIHFDEAPDPNAVRLTVSQVAGAESAARLRFEQIAAKDWVAASLAELKPVKAGRFTVHGAHDRARVPNNRISIEIEAALAFGTGHHGTTRGCLLALDRIAKHRTWFSPPPERGRSMRAAHRVGVASQSMGAPPPGGPPRRKA